MLYRMLYAKSPYDTVWGMNKPPLFPVETFGTIWKDAYSAKEIQKSLLCHNPSDRLDATGLVNHHHLVRFIAALDTE